MESAKNCIFQVFAFYHHFLKSKVLSLDKLVLYRYNTFLNINIWVYIKKFIRNIFVTRYLIYTVLHDIISIKKTQIIKHRKKDWESLYQISFVIRDERENLNIYGELPFISM